MVNPELELALIEGISLTLDYLVERADEHDTELEPLRNTFVIAGIVVAESVRDHLYEKSQTKDKRLEPLEQWWRANRHVIGSRK